jgi:hypothetical protein
MTIAPDDKLWLVRWQLESLAEIRMYSSFTFEEAARYRDLCRLELELMDLALVS